MSQDSKDDDQIVKDDKIKRAFARIGSIRKNLSEGYEIDETIAQEYISALSHLRAEPRILLEDIEHSSCVFPYH